jgi:hypothetical protein
MSTSAFGVDTLSEAASVKRYVGILYQDMFVLAKIVSGEDGFKRYFMIIIVALESSELRQSFFFEVVVRGRKVHARVRPQIRRLAICSDE